MQESARGPGEFDRIADIRIVRVARVHADAEVAKNRRRRAKFVPCRIYWIRHQNL